MYVSACIPILLTSFLLGSIPFGVLLAKAFKLPDPRGIGSGNIGATNMLRTGRKDVAALTLLLDGGKGILSVLLARHYFVAMVFDTARAAVDACGMQPTLDNCHMLVHSPAQAALALMGAVVGHCYSPWLGGKGGKGFATLIAGSFMVFWPLGVAMAVAWLTTFFVTRYSSLSAFAAIAALVYGGFSWLSGDAGVVLLITALIVLARHHQNIRNLLHGTESRFGSKQ